MEILQHRLEEVKKEAVIDKESEDFKKDDKDNLPLDDNLTDDLDNALDDAFEDDSLDDALKNDLDDTNSEDNNITSDYDVILQVKPEKIPKIKTQIIDGQKCIVIPVDENEQTTVNGLNDLI